MEREFFWLYFVIRVITHFNKQQKLDTISQSDTNSILKE